MYREYEDLFGNKYTVNSTPQPVSRKKSKQPSHYRLRINSLYLTEVTKGLRKTGTFDMPTIEPNVNIPTVVETTPFDRIRAKDANLDSLVTFYAHDNRFASGLSHPWDYTERLSLFSGVIAPDLSQYINMDYAARLYNNYANKVLTAYWQGQNVNIYPNVTWSLPDSYEYSVAGLPQRSVIAINSMGIRSSNFSLSVWLDGYNYMLNALDPICILRYGPKIPGENESISIYINNTQLNALRNGRKRK